MFDFFRKKDPLNIPDDIKKLRDKIISLSKEKQNFVATISGDWGKGKTFFWNNFIKKDLQKTRKEVAYISLFGKESLVEIKTEILIQISKDEKKLKYISSLISNTQILGTKIDLGAILNSLGKESFDNSIICFDDLERLSNTIQINEIVGLISMLKEQKNCKIFIILNEEKIEENNLLKYSNYKEKIIDYEFKFSPIIDSLYDVVKKDLLYFKDYPLEYFKSKGINNIRIMKRVINALNDFSFIKDLELNERVEQELAENIIEIFTVYSIFNTKDFKILSEYTFEKLMNRDENSIENKDFDNKLEYINYKETYEVNDITQVVLQYLNSFLVDKESTKKVLTLHNDNYLFYTIKDSIDTLLDKYNFDLNYSHNDFKNEIYDLMSNTNNIEEIISIDTFKFIIKACEEIETVEKQKYKDLGIMIFKKYIDAFLEDSDENKYDPWEQQKLHVAYEYDRSLELYYNAKVTEYTNLLVEEDSILLEILKNPHNNKYIKSYITTQEILAQLTEDDYYQLIFRQNSSFHVLYDFLIDTKQNSNYENEKNKILNTFETIITNNEGDIKSKLLRIKEILTEKHIVISQNNIEEVDHE